MSLDLFYWFCIVLLMLKRTFCNMGLRCWSLFVIWQWKIVKVILSGNSVVYHSSNYCHSFCRRSTEENLAIWPLGQPIFYAFSCQILSYQSFIDSNRVSRINFKELFKDMINLHVLLLTSIPWSIKSLEKLWNCKNSKYRIK